MCSDPCFKDFPIYQHHLDVSEVYDTMALIAGSHNVKPVIFQKVEPQFWPLMLLWCRLQNPCSRSTFWIRPASWVPRGPDTVRRVKSWSCTTLKWDLEAMGSVIGKSGTKVLSQGCQQASLPQSIRGPKGHIRRGI